MERNIDLFRGLGVEVILNDPSDFLKICETLTRIGVPSRDNQRLYQSCHILHKQGRYSILHFKELFKLDGKVSTLDNTDVERRNLIANLLHDWKLLEVVDTELLNKTHKAKVKIIPFSDKNKWELESKYTVGERK